MKAFAVICVLVWVIVVGLVMRTDAQSPGGAKSVPAVNQIALGAPPEVKWADDAKPAAVAGRRSLTLRQVRKLGLTLPNMAAAAKELKAAGEIDGSSSDAEIATAIAFKLESKNAAAFSSEGIDIEAIIAFIEKWLPKILRLIDLFSMNIHPTYSLAA